LEERFVADIFDVEEKDEIELFKERGGKNTS